MNTRRRSRRGKRARKYRGGEETLPRSNSPNPTDSLTAPIASIPAATTNSATANSTSGGKRRKTRKMSTGADTWREGVMRVYKELKAKKPSTRFGDALKEASRRKKAGNL